MQGVQGGEGLAAQEEGGAAAPAEEDRGWAVMTREANLVAAAMPGLG